jgi:hypothetical protein
MDAPRLEELAPAVSSLSDREAVCLFELWWHRWKPIWQMLFSNVTIIHRTLPAIGLLDPPWSTLPDDQVADTKIANRELSRFLRNPEVDSTSARWNPLSRVAWSAAPLIHHLLVARRSADCRQALVGIVRELPSIIASFSHAEKTGPIDMTLTDIRAVIQQFETPEVVWFTDAIRAILRRSSHSALREAAVAVQPVAVRLAAIAAARQPHDGPS